MESEPIRYELREIKVDKWRTQTQPTKTLLGLTTLGNNDEATNSIETVMSYQYEKIQYWGTYEGVGRGLPTEVFETNKPPVKLEKGWGCKESYLKTDVGFLENLVQRNLIWLKIFLLPE